MKMKRIITAAAGTALVIGAGLIMRHKSGRMECVYTMEGRAMMYGIVVVYGNKR